MKYLSVIPFILFSLFLNAQNPGLSGAWKNVSGDVIHIVLIQDGYFTSTGYSADAYKDTRGGTLQTEGQNLVIQQEFNTMQEKLTREVIPYQLNDDKLQLSGKTYTRLDAGNVPLAGVWKITGRKEGDKINEIHQRGTRKTLKMLTGTRFQWFAIDPDGNKFYGTGGGNYTFKNGKYTENIEFFSRDNSRVGASLSFDGKVEDGKWHHSGLSSRGDAIYEIWEKAY